ncbi:sphingosine-1-phosphate phosphohydrolase, putative [Ricinus communis]|uniref:Sphingosine-1-phosphate phosphohydrolase, putative n=1 Tax=Ricinus communis TaxID=3988 RepID=B9SYU5_RICCO|nr:sphingosine-1-phosphate phosphohydrolase, putative [Ricinus communis]|eukprot:XP_002531164.1 lipid phosphate phosphatase delta isoform X1 [Ricinus communis]
MESIPLWQGLTLCGIVSWIVISSCFNVTLKIRSFLQPWVTHHVISGTPLIIRIQKYQHGLLDAFFSGLSCVVSVPFYTAFLPLLFWSGHGKLARQMTLLMAFCDYTGNCIKDVVSAPRPNCPLVRRVTATKDEEDNALEYGLPSSHTLNTVCLSGYLLHYVLSYTQNQNASVEFAGLAIVCLFVGLIGFGRVYLGMHSVIDIIGGLVIGLAILAFWLTVHDYVDEFIILGQNVTTFWAALSFMLLFAYPTPEFPTPSFEYHTAFNGVAFGIVAGVQQTYHQFHHEAVPRVFTQLTVPAFLGRMLVGIPTILLVKFCSKTLAKWVLPVISNTLSLHIKSTSYIPMLKGSVNDKKSDEAKQSSYLQKLFFFSCQDSFNVDTGIRFLQYAGLAWSVVDLVPSLFSHLSL